MNINTPLQLHYDLLATAAGGVKGLAQRHLSGGNEGRASATDSSCQSEVLNLMVDKFLLLL